MSGFNHFNFIGPIYDRTFGRKVDREMLKLAEVESGQSLLDVGGGTGRVTILFKEITKNLLIADSASKMLHQAQEKDLRTVNSHSECLPFQNEIFDRVIMVDALHHVSNQQLTLNELWRVLAPGGRIIIEEPNIHNFIVKLVALGEKIALMRSRFISPEKIAEMCDFTEKESIQIHRKNGIAWIIITKNYHEN